MREHLTEQHKQRIAEAHRGLTIRPEVREKIRKTMTGRKLSDETKHKISKASKGRTFTPEQRRKLSEALKRYNRLNPRGSFFELQGRSNKQRGRAGDGPF